MKENRFLFNQLGNTSYSLTVSVNGKNYKWNESSRAPNWELEMYFVYNQLIDALKKLLCDAECNNQSAVQQFRNHVSTLNGFLTYVGKTDDDRIGSEMKSGFTKATQGYLDALDVSARTKSDRRSHLKKWLNVFEQISNIPRETKKPLLRQFNLALKQALIDAGMSQASLIDEAKISKSTLAKWLKGAQPNTSTTPCIHRVEMALGLERESLTHLITEDGNGNRTHPLRKIEYRERLSELINKPYRLKIEQISPNLAQEWQEYFDYKISEHTDLKRSKRGMWRLKPIKNNAKICKYACKGSSGSATANIMFYQMLNFLGFLCLSKSEGGYGLHIAEVQTMGWYAHPAAVNAFLEFIKDRSDGIKHRTHQRIASHVISLTSLETGYLWQKPNLLNKIPAHLIPRSTPDWYSMCSKSSEIARAWKNVSVEKSRRPEEPIAPLLALPTPVEPILRAIRHLDAKAAGMPSGGVVQATLKRDALLLAFLISNPLRVLNFKIMTWSQDSSKHLYKTADQQYRLRFDGSEMKTKKSYDVRIAGWLVTRLEEYLEEYRDVLLQDRKSDYLFLSSNKKTIGKWNDMDRHIYKLTQSLIPETLGFGPHAFRHIVATDWLRRYPNDFITVASLLNDSLETVISNYSHLKLDDAFSRYEDHLIKIIDSNGRPK